MNEKDAVCRVKEAKRLRVRKEAIEKQNLAKKLLSSLVSQKGRQEE